MTIQLLQQLAATSYGSGSQGGHSLIILATSLAALVFSFYMLIDAIRQPIKNKATWIVVILVFGVVGAVLYALFGRNKFNSGTTS